MRSIVSAKMVFSWMLAFAFFSAMLKADDPQPASRNDDPEHAAKMAAGLKIFKSDVRTVLAGRCLKCHGGEESEGEFDLSTRAGLLKGGAEGKAVVLGNSKASLLYKLIAHTEEPAMPEDGAKLDDRLIKAIAKWIDLGAPYDKSLISENVDPLAWTQRKVDDASREFWSFQPLRHAKIPQLENDTWSKTDIDRFVLAKLREHRLSPGGPIGRRKLIRRAYFDLIGLPPTGKQVDAFVNDNDPRAFEKVIDQLLESPHYGERWGRHWLDIARFAESHGFEQDYDRPHAFHYRDFVIKAFNQDMPYDQFVRWQLAGDEFAPKDPLAMMATGFLGAGVFPTQLTEKEFEPARYDELDDMVATMGTAMLGMTIGCARCHDHKFDPIPQADYYRLISTFATTIRSNIDLDLDPARYQAEKAAFDRQHGPLIVSQKKYEEGEFQKKYTAWLSEPANLNAPPAKWQTLDFTQFKSTQGATMAKLDDGSILLSGKKPSHDVYVFQADTHLRVVTAVRIDALTHKSMVKNGPGRASNGNFSLTNLKVTAQPLADLKQPPVEVKFGAVRATHEQNKSSLSVKSSIDDNNATGWAVDAGGIGKDQSAVFDFATPVETKGGVRLTFELKFNNNTQHSLGRPRFSITGQPAPVSLEGTQANQHLVDALQKLQLGEKVEQLSAEQATAVRNRFAHQDARWRELRKAIDDHAKLEPKPNMAKVMVSSEGFKPIPHHGDGRGFPHFYKDTYFLKRGDALQKLGVASQGFLQVLMRTPEQEGHWQVAPPENWRTSYRRRALANWMTDTEYGAGQLLARVIVNRLWHNHFGRGIVSTPNDFGFQGERPTHPELLDWLAARLIKDQWRLKALQKLITTSAVYQQSSEFDEQGAKIDPDNRWCWRYAPRRLEAEVIRDSMLAISGQLDRKMFGAGTLSEGMKRRSIYFMVKRSKLIPMMQVFDSPEPLVSVGSRPSTTIAPQALMFMNSPHVRGYALSLADQIAAGAKSSHAEAVRQGYLIALGRAPAENELNDNVKFVEQQMASYQLDKHANARQLALADFCQILMCLNEFVYVE